MAPTTTPDVDLPDGVTVRLMSHDVMGISGRDVALARQISAAASDLGVPADSTAMQTVQVAVDALVGPDVMPFWCAVLGYEQVGDEDLLDPHRRGPSLWFQEHVTRVNGDVLPTLLVDGYVAGVWRPVEGGIEASAFHPLPDNVWEGLGAARSRTFAQIRAARGPARPRPFVPNSESRWLTLGLGMNTTPIVLVPGFWLGA